MIFRLRYQELGGHTHVRVFVGSTAASLGKCGDLVFRNEEWKRLVTLLKATPIQVIAEGTEAPE